MVDRACGGSLCVSLFGFVGGMRYGDVGGVEALASKGPPGPDPVLSDVELARLKQRLERGPAAAGYGADQRWTLARVAALIVTLFHRQVSIATVWQVMRRLGYTAQLPVHRAVERDEQAITHWRRYRWPALKESRVG